MMGLPIRYNLKGECEVRPYRSGDEGEIVELLQLVFDGWPKIDLGCSALDHWKWKYRDNPTGECLVNVCVDGGKIIGVRHSIPQRIWMAGRLFYSTYTGDAAVHPEYQGMGVLTKMRIFIEEFRKKFGFTYVYWVTSNPVIIESSSRKFHVFPHPIVNLVRILDIDEQLRAMPLKHGWLTKLGYHAAKMLNDVKISVGGSKTTSDTSISTIKNFDTRIDEFWRQVSAHCRYTVDRSREYLNWRYLDPRGGDFVVNIAVEDERITGYSVLRINRLREDYPVGFVVDLISLPDRLDVVDSLASNAVHFFDERKINIINYQLVKNHPYEKVFKSHGFLDSGIQLQYFCEPSGADEEFNKLKESPADRLYYSYGDIDSLPVTMPSYR